MDENLAKEEEKRDRPVAGKMKNPDTNGLLNGHKHVITDNGQGGKRIPYARILVELTPKGIATEFAKKTMLERYGAEYGKYDIVQECVYMEIIDDFMAGFAVGFKRYGQMIKNGQSFDGYEQFT